MKRTVWIGAVILACAVASAQYMDYGTELRGSVNYGLAGAGDFDLYDGGLGLELQYRNWLGDPFGFALSLGWAEWDAGDGRDVGGDTFDQFSGSVSLTPLGVSGLYKLADWVDCMLTLEAGLRYVLVNSDITARRAATGEDVELDIDNGVTLLFAADYERSLGDDWWWFAGAGYQMDLDDGQIKVDGTLRSSELQAFFIRLGAKTSF